MEEGFDSSHVSWSTRSRHPGTSGEIVVYLMPTQDFDTKVMRIDPVSGTALLFANKRNARVVKVEPLD